MVTQLGNVLRGATLDFKYHTTDKNGGAIAPSVEGTVSVYKDNSTTQTTTGVTVTHAFDGVTGLHHVRIVTTDAFYATGTDFQVTLTGATIDSETVDVVLAHFSVENRPTVLAGSTISAVNDVGATTTEFDTDLTEASDDHYNGDLVVFTSGNLQGQATRISDYTGSSKNITVNPALTEAPADDDTFIIIPNRLWGVDALPELAKAKPAATPTAEALLMFIYMLVRNKTITTETLLKLFNDAGTEIARQTIGDDGTDFTRDEFESAP